jgi:ribosomal protein S18 acetylase RimI-like enzyme
MRIRDYKKSDYPSVIRLWKECGLWGEERDDSLESINKCLSLGGKFLVMQEERTNKIIGTSWITFDGRRMYLHHFCIKPEYQGKGHGESLTKASLEFIKKQGHQVKLEVHKDNLPAIKLYEKYGFFKFDNYIIYMIRDTPDILSKSP